MARQRRQPRPDLIAPILGDRPIIPATLRVQAIENDIKDTVAKGMGQRLKVAPSALPQELQDVIATTSAVAAQRAIELEELKKAVAEIRPKIERLAASEQSAFDARYLDLRSSLNAKMTEPERVRAALRLLRRGRSRRCNAASAGRAGATRRARSRPRPP